MNEVAKNIFEAIKNANLSYGEVGEMTGIPKSAIHRYATGQTDKVPSNRLELIAKATGTTPAHLLGWDKQQKSPDEAELLKLFTALSEDDRKKVLEYALLVIKASEQGE